MRPIVPTLPFAVPDPSGPGAVHVTQALRDRPLVTAEGQAGAVVLHWTDGTPVDYTNPATWRSPKNEIGFSVQRAPATHGQPAAGDWTRIGKALANQTSFTDTRGSTSAYAYRVVAFNASGNAASAPVLAAPAPAPAPLKRSAPGVPAAYRGLRVVVDLDGLFITQFDGSAFEHGNCNMAAGAMLYEVQTGLRVSGGEMRAWSGATSLGTSIDDLARAFGAQGQPLAGRSALAWRDFVAAVAAGRSAVVQGWYGTLPARYRLQAGFTAGHSVFVLAYSPLGFEGTPGFYVLDPLGGDAYLGRWWPSAVLESYGWSGVASRPRGQNHFFGDVALQAHAGAATVARPAARDLRAYWRTVKAAIASARTARAIAAAVPQRALLGAVLVADDPRLAPGSGGQPAPWRGPWRARGPRCGRAGRWSCGRAPGHPCWPPRRAWWCTAAGPSRTAAPRSGCSTRAAPSAPTSTSPPSAWRPATGSPPGSGWGSSRRSAGGSGPAGFVRFIVSQGSPPSDLRARLNPRHLLEPR